MERIQILSEYLRRKDAEAENKLDQAQELFRKVCDMESCFEDAENQRREIYETRMVIARERVAMLKEVARERVKRRTSMDIALVRRPMRQTTDFNLASIKADLEKIRREKV
jgi:hypothetical protein